MVQLADAAFKIINLLDTIKEGARLDENCAMDTLLWMTRRNLETQFTLLSSDKDGAWIKPIETLAEPQGVFERLREALYEVWLLLTADDSKRKSVLQTLRWPLDQGYVERMTIDEEKFRKIIDWLSPCNFVQKQEVITDTPGTGSWFFASDEFESWLSGSTRWLWCHGIPGAGKTFIASKAVCELQKMHESEDTSVLIAFCSFDSPESQSIDHLVTALLKQIVQTRMVLPEGLEDMYSKHRACNTRPKIANVCLILGEAISRSTKVFIILDALGELPDDARRLNLLNILHGLKGNAKVLTASRKIESIAGRFSQEDIACDGCEKEDLDTYSHCEEEDLCQMIERQPNLRIRKQEAVFEGAQDMFLQAKFHMDAVADCLTIEEINEALDNSPQQINDTYDQAMARIAKLSHNRQRAVKKSLLWVSYAERGLTKEEVQHAMAISIGSREIKKEHFVNIKVLTSLAADLIVIDGDETVRLTHKTAEDYFSEKG
ncbi:hypothetical protein P154DRAFT_582763 [Amniculicola lignicola CBS 123094]|uniref:Uncharacterized protein n=1 Tax=Amniculicola lignicola CBS 123094 TaxID=1392246 RepID=A0A6A5VX64_9PLEO|nr:hypothetical protein P154DRAFT_582763 [Amniculicola lignicola CBS 123094]